MFFCITSRSLPMKVWSSVLRALRSSFPRWNRRRWSAAWSVSADCQCGQSNTEPENGFVRYESAPCRGPLRGCLAGGRGERGSGGGGMWGCSAFSWRVNSSPSITGIITSQMTSLGTSRRAFSSPSLPLAASEMLYFCFSMEWRYERMPSLSSMMSTSGRSWSEVFGVGDALCRLLGADAGGHVIVVDKPCLCCRLLLFHVLCRVVTRL